MTTRSMSMSLSSNERRLARMTSRVDISETVLCSSRLATGTGGPTVELLEDVVGGRLPPPPHRLP